MSGAVWLQRLQPGLPQRRSDHDPEVRPVGVWRRRLRLDRSHLTAGGLREASQIAVGGLIGRSFGGLILQAYLTTDVYEKNYGGHDPRLWGRVILPLWTAPTAPAAPPSMMYRKG